MRITAVRVTNFKRVRDVAIAPEADRVLILIGGKNAQGKSSALDALTVAFGGKRAAPADPVRHGADEAVIDVELDGGDLTIHRVIDAGGESKLEVREKGSVIRSPQARLDKLVGRGSSIRSRSCSSTATEQRAQLLAMFDKDGAIAKLEEHRERIFQAHGGRPRPEEGRRASSRASRRSGRRADRRRRAQRAERASSPSSSAGRPEGRARDETRGASQAAAGPASVDAVEREIDELEKKLASDAPTCRLVKVALDKAAGEQDEIKRSSTRRCDLERAEAAPRQIDADLASARRAQPRRVRGRGEQQAPRGRGVTSKQLEQQVDQQTELLAKIEEQKLALLAAAACPSRPRHRDRWAHAQRRSVRAGVGGRAAARRARARDGCVAGLDDVWIRDGALLDDDSLQLLAEQATQGRQAAVGRARRRPRPRRDRDPGRHRCGYSVQQIADKTGKSKAYIHARLKLCDIAGSAAKTAFLENKVNASVALIAARIPVPKLQDAFIKRVVAGESDDQMVNGEWIKVDRPLSFREAQLLAQKEFMLRLENAPFPIIDDKLVKGVGSCVGCLFRTGNQRELFDDVKSADVCTNPPCFQKKKDAQTERELDAWKKEGKKVLSKTEAEKVFDYREHNDEYHLGWNSTYADVTQKPPYDVDRKGRTWEQLFGGKDKIPSVHARDPNGKNWQLIHKASAVKELTKLGVFKEKKASKSSARSSGPGKPKAPTEHELIESAVWKKLMVAAADKLEPKLAKGDAGAWRWLVEFLVEFAGLGEGYAPLKAWGGFNIVSGPDIEKKLLAGAKTGEDLRRLAIAAVLADRLGMSTATKDVEKLCKPLGIDMKKVALQAADDVKAELAKAKDAKSAPKKKGA
jgi:hypothetical protein